MGGCSTRLVGARPCQYSADCEEGNERYSRFPNRPSSCVTSFHPHTAKQGWALPFLPDGGKAPAGSSMAPLMDTILREVPPPAVADTVSPFSMLVSMIERCAI